MNTLIMFQMDKIQHKFHLKSNINYIKNNIKEKMKKFICNHSYISFGILLFAMPIMVLLVVTVSTVLITFPISCIMGWI